MRRFATRAALDAALAARLLRAALYPASRATAAIMLAGGETPRAAYGLAATLGGTAHDDVRIVQSDERHVPPDSEASNWRRLRPLLDGMRIPADHVVRVRTDLPPDDATRDYAQRLAELLAAGFGIGFAVLGLGADGHTAALFTADDLARTPDQLAIRVRRPDGRDAVTVTPALIARIAEPLFVVAGADKRAPLASLARGDPTLVAWQAVAGCVQVEVWADADAYPTQERVQP